MVKFVLIVIAVIASGAIGTYYRQLDKRGQEYNQLGPIILAVVAVAFLFWIMQSPP